MAVVGLMPGTGLARDFGGVLKFIWLHLMPRMLPLLRLVISPNIHTPQESGANLAWVALDSSVAGTSGKYYEGKKEIRSSKDSYDEAKQDNLWEWTVANISANEEEKQRFDALA
jgi:hypothetical protein